jgi:hypothetical protein
MKNILIIVKLICLLMLFYQIVVLSIDYLSFPYSVKLEIVENNNYLPAITLCTKCLFNKKKVISYFNLSKHEYNKKGSDEKLDTYFKRLVNKFTEEKINLTLSANEFIKCSAKLHDSQSFKSITISDCAEKTEIIESLYRENRVGERNSGKCFTHFADFKRESFIFQNNDLVRFELNRTDLIPKQYSIFVHNSRFLSLQFDDLLFKYDQFLVHQELRFRKTEVNFLSWPYKNDCHRYSGNLTNTVLFCYS